MEKEIESYPIADKTISSWPTCYKCLQDLMSGDKTKIGRIQMHPIFANELIASERDDELVGFKCLLCGYHIYFA